MKVSLLILTFFCNIIVFSQLSQTTLMVARPQMKMNESSTLNQTHQNQTRQDETCSYRVTIETSCLSPYVTTDQIDIKFGDAFGSEVYVPRLDAVDGAMFDRCSAIAFDITGPCCNRICKIYLFRRGRDGWAPYSATIDDYKYAPVPFFFNNPYIPVGDSRVGDDFC